MKNVVDYGNAIVLHLKCVVLHMLSYYNLKLLVGFTLSCGYPPTTRVRTHNTHTIWARSAYHRAPGLLLQATDRHNLIPPPYLSKSARKPAESVF